MVRFCNLLPQFGKLSFFVDKVFFHSGELSLWLYNLLPTFGKVGLWIDKGYSASVSL